MLAEFSLQRVSDLASNLESLPDERFDWLRDLDTDPTSVYYRFFFELTRLLKPAVVLEIGTCEGKSAAHLAAGHPGATVMTLDVKPEAKALADSLMVPNLVAIICDSLEVKRKLRWMPQIDLLFIDGDHSMEQVYREYTFYRPFVRSGGLIFFDDIHINPGMEMMWRSVADPKVELKALHYTGFGVAFKDPSVQPIPLGELLGIPSTMATQGEAETSR